MKEAVPKENLLEWDFTKNTFEDLCRFCDVSPCPRSGPLPQIKSTFFNHADMPITSCTLLAVGMFYYWVNWRLLCWLCGGLCGCGSKKSRKSVSAEKKNK